MTEAVVIPQKNLIKEIPEQSPTEIPHKKEQELPDNPSPPNELPPVKEPPVSPPAPTEIPPVKEPPVGSPFSDSFR